jgi:glycosyltransferase involved in cell wall biosynthesis
MPAQQRSICFVTNEVYPVDKGGIARLMYNFAKANAASGGAVAVHLLLPHSASDGLPVLEEAFAGLATIHVCRRLRERPEELARLIASGPQEPWDFSGVYPLSLEYLYGLLDAERRVGEPFTIVEFLDFGGFAVAAIAAKRTGLAFRQTLVSVRLHSSLGLIVAYEKFRHHPSLWLGCVLDAERDLLAHADLVIGHVPAVAERNAVHYGFGLPWRRRLRIEFPAIDLDAERETVDPAALGPKPARQPDFVFSSRLQPFKRPDLFVNAAVAFLERWPDYEGRFRLVSYGWDLDYIQSVKDLVPPGLGQRIIFEEGLSATQRQCILRQSIVVIPSDFESLCLFAYEASQLGCKIILNRRCEAFGDFDRWHHGVNCLMFDGSGLDLAETMMQAIEWVPMSQASAVADPPYWLDAGLPGPRALPDSLPRTALCCHGFTDPAEIALLLLSLRLLDDLGEIDLIFFLPQAVMPPDSASSGMLSGFGVHYLSGYGRSAEELGAALLDLDCDIIVLLQPGYQLHPRYLRSVRTAMAGDPRLGICSTHVRLVDPRTETASGVTLYAGDLPSLAMQRDSVAPPVFAFRRTLLNDHMFDDRAGRAWCQVWLREAVLAGIEAAILPMAAIDHRGAAITQAAAQAISGSIIDSVGMTTGLRPRLIALEPKPLAEEGSGLPVETISGDGLRAGDLLWPPLTVSQKFPLVRYQEDHQGLLVHPLTRSAVIARIRGPLGAIRLLEVDFANTHADNQGVEVAVALAATSDIDLSLAEAFASGRPPMPHLISAWHLVSPASSVTVSLRSMMQPGKATTILLLSRVPRGGTDRWCHLIVRTIRSHVLKVPGA